MSSAPRDADGRTGDNRPQTATTVSGPDPTRRSGGAPRPHRRRAAVFVALTFGCSWVPWLLLVTTSGDPLANPASTVLWIAGGYGPTLAALITARLLDGRAGVRRLLRGLRRWRLGGWYLTLLLPLPVAVVAVLIVVATGPATLDVAGLGHWGLLPIMMLGGILLGGLEELGWRGYLLPRLQPWIGPNAASVVIGLVWALWHAPLFLLDSTSQASHSPAWFTLHAVALSLLLTWLYNGSGGSILLAVLFHGMINGAYEAAVAGLAPEALDGFLAPATLLFAALAVTVLAQERQRRSHRRTTRKAPRRSPGG